MSKIQGDRTNEKYIETSNKSHAKLITVAWSQIVAFDKDSAQNGNMKKKIVFLMKILLKIHSNCFRKL